MWDYTQTEPVSEDTGGFGNPFDQFDNKFHGGRFCNSQAHGKTLFSFFSFSGGNLIPIAALFIGQTLDGYSLFPAQLPDKVQGNPAVNHRRSFIVLGRQHFPLPC